MRSPPEAAIEETPELESWVLAPRGSRRPTAVLCGSTEPRAEGVEIVRKVLSLAAAGAAVLLACASAVPASASRPQGYDVKVFVQGAPIHGANGLAVDPQGRLLVASVWGGEIVALDRQTGAVIERLGDGVGVDGPDDVAIGPDGSIYWTDILLGRVGRLAPDGTTTTQDVAPGMNPIAFDADGRLFVGQAFFGDGLYELDPDLVDTPRVVIPDTGPTAEQLNGFDFGPDGMLYAPQPNRGTIVRIDPQSGAMETVAQGLAAPSSVEFDAQGRLYASISDGSVILVDRSTGATEVVAQIRDAILDNMVFDASGRLFVSDSDDGAVYSIAPGGGVRTLSPGGLMLPGGLALMESAGRDSLFVADVWGLSRFNARSGTMLGIDRQARFGTGIVEPWTVAPDGDNLIVTSWMSNAVQIWDPVSHAAERVYTDFAMPLDAIRFRDDLVVAQLGTGSVARETPGGTRSIVASGLAVPTGLAATDDDLWVADWATGIVWEIVSNGSVLDAPRFVAGGLRLPEGMAVDRDGSLLVVESGAGRLSRIDPGSGAVTTVADGLATGLPASVGAPPVWALSTPAVASDGTIYVTGDRANVVYRVKPVPAS
jgi:sugar lactone lactonase YvrE